MLIHLISPFIRVNHYSNKIMFIDFRKNKLTEKKGRNLGVKFIEGMNTDNAKFNLNKLILISSN